MTNADVIRAYIAALNAGANDEALAFFAPDVVQEEFPNRLIPGGATRDLEALKEASRRGRAVVERQTFEIHTVIAEGDRVAAEATWTGIMKVPLGNTPPGEPVTARFAMFFVLRDGKIVRQHNYDCFDEF
jgi:ketosteroid isomerase-like protein